MVVKTFHQKNAEKNTATPSVVTDDSATFAPKTFYHQQAAIMDNSSSNQPKALFKPNIQATIETNDLALVNEAIIRLDLDDHAFSQSELNKAILLKSTIRIDDASYVTDYGSEASQHSESILNQLNTITRTDYADGVRSYLAKILEATQKVELDSLRTNRNPSFFDRFLRSKVNNKARFMELERDIKSNMTFCQNRLNQLKKTQQVFSELFSKNEQQFRELTVYLLAGQLRLEEEQLALQHLPEQANNVFAHQAQLDKKDALSRFERRLQTLKVLRHTVLLRIGQLRLEQKNTLTLIDQANEMLNLMIPAWRQQIMALFSLSSSDNNSELYAQLAATQESLNKQLLSLS
ncbi:MAG: toxic anion resistance protein [Moraxellaceae bacterium]|nr:toxic anion resistance protein [Moraxellaceae bacterium]MCC6374028.1 toxic anion resistance protein [Moraxellaceae bacterium]